jgi:hypothetical protein
MHTNVIMKSSENRSQVLFMQKFVKSSGAFTEMHFETEKEIDLCSQSQMN